MSISFMHEVIKIADRFNDRKDPDALDRQGHLNQVLIVVVIFHAIMGISFVKMEEYERKHPHAIANPNLSFEFIARSSAPLIEVTQVVPPPIDLTIGANPDPGAEDSSRHKQEDKTSIEANKAPERDLKQKVEAAKSQPASRETTKLLPVAVSNYNPVKPLPAEIQPAPTKETSGNDSQNTDSTDPASGAHYTASKPVQNPEIGNGEGGRGPGGHGSKTGIEGPGTGIGPVGSIDKISTVVPQHERAVANIAPYRKELLLKIAAVYHPRRRSDLTVLLRIAKDGKVLNTEVLSGSGHPQSDAEAAILLQTIEYDPLPEWYQGESLTFKINLASLKMERD